jgi:DeoR/GlpR family transcriptional regulator of sugar metabolism
MNKSIRIDWVRLKPEQRQREILARLRAVRTELTVEELAGAFHVSTLTIRRDLDQLEGTDAILRTHGGCVIQGEIASAYRKRIALNFELKRAIGRAAAAEVHPGQTILISDGSTTFHLATHLAECNPLAVYTNSIAIVKELSWLPHTRLYVLGGEYQPKMQFLGGSITERILEMLDFDAVFLGADAIDAHGQCLVPTAEEARLTQIMLRCGRRKYLLADHTKATAQSYAAYAEIGEFDLWLTTPGLNKGQLRKFRKRTKIKEV